MAVAPGVGSTSISWTGEEVEEEVQRGSKNKDQDLV